MKSNGKSKFKSDKMICPYCGCDAWHIGNVYFQCFLCKTVFVNKRILLNKNIFSLNMNLKFLKDIKEIENGESGLYS